MSDKSYTYELFRWDSEHIKGYINLNVTPDRINVDDFTYGDSPKTFFGTSSHGIEMWVDREGSSKVLDAHGIPAGNYPTETLGLWLAERFTGNDSAFSAIRELVEAAGVTPMVWVD